MSKKSESEAYDAGFQDGYDKAVREHKRKCPECMWNDKPRAGCKICARVFQDYFKPVEESC